MGWNGAVLSLLIVVYWTGLFPRWMEFGRALPKKLDTLDLKARWSRVDEGAGTSRQQALPPNIVTISLAPLSLSPWTVHGCLASRYPALHLPRPSQTYPDSSATDEAGRQDIRDFIASLWILVGWLGELCGIDKSVTALQVEHVLNLYNQLFFLS